MPELEALLAQALLAQARRGPGGGSHSGSGADGHGGSEGERRAVAAFRAARDAGAHQTRTRRRDDWRPRTRRYPARSLRATLSVLVAGLALGGVAFAAIGSATDGRADAGGPGRPPAASSAGARSTGSPLHPTSAATAGRDRPGTAKDTRAHCRAYENVRGRGRAMDSTAWQRLVAAAGGEEKVAAYCAAQGGPKTEKTEKAEKAGRTPKAGRPATPDVGSKAGNTPGPAESEKPGVGEKPAKTAGADGNGTAGNGVGAAGGGAQGG
ncbi:hypothetical protein OHS71_16155 [Streptomyces sp. NBC_00377]|uniref:hypothetical protein n=1 Tax=unclassified Streptomyces TaxID=2593676 RepID=UPI002E24E451|nr:MULTISPECIES: hypothetical protein [unclassified Streptomyces]